MSQERSEVVLTKIEVAQAMGLVVALRFLLWGAAVSAITGFALLQAGRFPQLLKVLSIPMLFAIYLLGTGHVLLLLRFSNRTARFLLLAPAIGLMTLTVSSVLTSPPLIAAVFGLSLLSYLVGFSRQVSELSYRRAASWFGLSSKATLCLTLIAVLVPGAAGVVSVVGGMVLALATAVGWQIWLAELRDSLART